MYICTFFANMVEMLIILNLPNPLQTDDEYVGVCYVFLILHVFLNGIKSFQ